jgi:toxin ParE1/3/4
MRIVWSPTAIANLAEIRAYIEKDKPEAALSIAKRIVASVDRLSRNPRLGRLGHHAGTRELIIPGTPYLIPYKIERRTIKILAVFHTAQPRPEK